MILPVICIIFATMKRTYLLSALLLLSTSFSWGQAVSVPESFLVIDMRDGLAESRIRQIKQMPDGRMAIATSATIDIYDGTRFTSYRLQPEQAYPLHGYHGNRQLTCDVAGRVWLRNEQTLHVVDVRKGKVVGNIDSLLKVLKLKEQDIVAWPRTSTPYEYKDVKEVMTVERDCYGGLWIGTKENGILYSNLQRVRQFHTEKQPFKFPRKPNHATERTRRLEAAFAPQASNCMLDDNIGSYAYLGTFRGLMIFDKNDRHVATLDEHYGLHTANVQALIHDGKGDVWASTSNGITRIRCTGRDSFNITNYGRLDGIRVEGREFRPGQIHKDSTGKITVGFVGGVVTFLPDSVNAPCYSYHYPKTESTADTTPDHISYWIILLLVIPLLPMAIYIRKRRMQQNGSNQQPPTGTKDRQTARHSKTPAKTRRKEPLPHTSEETLDKLKQTDEDLAADKQFLIRLQKLVEENISSEEFSVQTLSDLMAMERSGLYRRVQTLTGLSPSNYIKRVRMDVAVRLLRETELPVADIASRTGFSTTKYFNKVFKEAFSMTPTDYREYGKSAEAQK